MSLPGPSNVAVDVYRGYNPADPYSPPNQPAALTGVPGVLKNHMRNGRFGYVLGGNVAIWWTNVLLVAPGTDVRSAYNSELNSFSEANGDTVMVPDYPIAGTCTAFVVVMVQRVSRGTAGDYLRCYLDRAQPNYGHPCSGGGQSTTCCPGVTIPNTLHATLSGGTGSCTCLNGLSFPLTWTGAGWSGTFNGCGTGTYPLDLACQSGTWVITSSGCIQGKPATSVSCSPLSLGFAGCNCFGCCSGTINVTVTP
jgi:hypothetical protein